MNPRSVTRFALIFAAITTPLAISSTSFFYLSRFKEFFLLFAAAGSLVALSSRYVFIWAASAIGLALMTLPTPEKGAAHIWVIVGSSYVAIALAVKSTLIKEDYCPIFRAIAVASLLLGVDSVLQGVGLPSFVAAYSAIMDGSINTKAFFLLESPEVVRSFSFTGNPNHLGAWALVAIPILAGARHDDRNWNTVYLAGVVAGIAAVYFSYSRACYLGLLFLSLFVVLKVHRAGLQRHRNTFMAITAAICFAALLFPRLATLLDHRSVQLNDRLDLWKGAVYAFSARPLAGWGLGGFGPAYSIHAPSSWWNEVTLPRVALDAHSEWITIAVELGALGVAIAIAAVVWVGARVLAAIKNDPDPAGVWFAGTIFALFFISFFSVVLRLPQIGLLLIIASGRLLLNDERKGDGSAYQCRPEPIRRARLVSVFALMIAVTPAYVADSYSRYAFFAQADDKERAARWAETSIALRPSDPSTRYLAGFLGLPGSLPALLRLSDEYPGYRDMEFSLSLLYKRADQEKIARDWNIRSQAVRPIER